VPAQLIDGKALAEQIRNDITQRVAALKAQGRSVGLHAVLVGDDAAAESYAQSQAKHAGSVGIDYQLHKLPDGSDEAAVADLMQQLNEDPAVSGIILQLPLPKGIDADRVQPLIAPGKDVEGVGAANFGALAMGRPALAPCTAAAAFECLKSTGVDMSGKRAVVVGRSNIVGKPLAMLLLAANATVTQCHSRTRNLPAVVRAAEIVMVSVGVPQMVTSDFIAPGAIVVDVGTNRVSANDPGNPKRKKTVGDVVFEEAKKKASHITPVPGGVGPVTVAMLLQNTVTAAERIAG